jgi:hypothetical protein
MSQLVPFQMLASIYFYYSRNGIQIALYLVASQEKFWGWIEKSLGRGERRAWWRPHEEMRKSGTDPCLLGPIMLPMK